MVIHFIVYKDLKKKRFLERKNADGTARQNCVNPSLYRKAINEDGYNIKYKREKKNTHLIGNGQKVTGQ